MVERAVAGNRREVDKEKAFFGHNMIASVDNEIKEENFKTTFFISSWKIFEKF